MKNYSNLNIKQKKVFWKENPLHGEVEIKIQEIENFKMYNENDDTVVKELYWTNFMGWEYTSLVLWNDLSKLNKSGVIYDIGSYTGVYSIIAAKHSRENKVFAFDIQTNTLERLRKNCLINDLNNVFGHNKACTDFNGETTFSFYQEEGIISSVASLVQKKMNNLNQGIDAIKLDDFNSEISKNHVVRLLKIDVEDAELNTLAGMQKILSVHSPDVLVEINNYNNLKKVKKLFPKAYRIYDIDEDNFSIRKIGWFSKPSKHRNYLFTIKKKRRIRDVFTGRVI
ncbi:FkbM family methyltransferase [Seonamhaeicola maritimus]|uniref:FkbM family methyltransferase n=1 Tax=Seonamhaeicola maritimus TaxID=2591822 RepID=A0A5C7GKP7_9FLAO|nr:FkbM family methyltransferase [Seonamhaeicola maritimus]TXG38864.1 FkbM family methyltransferase [Seonamhaeicola maritimus]